MGSSQNTRDRFNPAGIKLYLKLDNMEDLNNIYKNRNNILISTIKKV